MELDLAAALVEVERRAEALDLDVLVARTVVDAPCRIVVGDTVGDRVVGDIVVGAPVVGDIVVGAPVVGDTVVGDRVVGDAVVGDRVDGDAVVGDAVVGDAVVGDSDVSVGRAAQVGLAKVSPFIVTAPFRARARPWTVTPLFTDIEVRARMLPRKTELLPRVAELPTCQNTLHSSAPLIRFTVLLDAVISVESVWKMKTELALFSPSRVSEPVRLSGDLSGPWYTPPGRVRLTRSGVVVVFTGRPAASSSAMIRSDWACRAAAFVVSVDPGGTTRPGGNPLIDGPGQSPRLPFRTVPFVFVTVEPPSTA